MTDTDRGNYVVSILRARKEERESVILASESEIERLTADIAEQREFIRQKREQLVDLNEALEKLERA